MHNGTLEQDCYFIAKPEPLTKVPLICKSISFFFSVYAFVFVWVERPHQIVIEITRPVIAFVPHVVEIDWLVRLQIVLGGM